MIFPRPFQNRPIRVTLCVLATLLAPIATVAAANHPTLELNTGWRIQPATHPGTPPDPAAWGRSRMIELSAGWNTNQPVAQPGNAPWKNIDRAKVNSLWHETTFTPPAAWEKRSRVFVDFSRVDGDAIVFLNGKRIAEMPAPGGELELTAALNPGRENTLTVFNTRDYTGMSRTFEQDLLRHTARTGREKLPLQQWPLGITGPVTLTARPPSAIVDVFAIPSWRQKTLGLEIEVDAASDLHNSIIDVSVHDKDGRQVLALKSSPAKIPAGRSVHHLKTPWADPVTWELEKPYLYTITARLSQGDRLLDTNEGTTFGFREVWTEGRLLMLNGHPIRLRLTDLFGADANALSFYRLIGYNSGALQPHPKLWWRDWNDIPLLDEALIAEADRLGFALTAPVPSISYLGTAFIDNIPLQEAYTAEMKRHLRKYRNHPSVLAWSVGMNSYNPRENIHAGTLGRRETPNPFGRARVIEIAAGITKRNDPTRLAFSHADGSLADISSANVYLNFVPLQEREEWPMGWARDGDMPYAAVEFGQPFEANFWKNRQFLLTEFASIYLGERAYEIETEAGLRDLVRTSAIDWKKLTAWSQVDDANYPVYWEFQDLFVNATNRSWRTWGVNGGWKHWLLSVGYGNPPGLKPGARQYTYRYRNLPGPVEKKPEWANPNFDIHAKSNKTFLAWIAGGGVHTDKTHAFYTGEKFGKQIALVWDGSDPETVTVDWVFTRSGGNEPLASGTREVTLAPGDISFIPLDLTAPPSPAGDAALTMRVRKNGQEIARDSFSIQVFERSEKPDTGSARFALIDPAGRSAAWLRSLGLNPEPWAPSSPDRHDVLIVGREALQPGAALPWTAADIERGLKVLILEQQPAVWEMLGFETVETLPRYTFAANPNPDPDRGSPVLRGLRDVDLVNWRGSPDLLPEGRQVRTYDTPRAPRWTNRHAVASVAIKIPEVAGFTPILKTEFDLSYTPLLEWRHGRGAVYYSSIDFTGRIGSDPAATRLASNLLQTLAAPLPPTRKVYYHGSPEGAALLRAVHAGLREGSWPENAADATQALLVLDRDASAESPDTRARIAAFLRQGGNVLHLPQTQASLAAAGYASGSRSLVRAPAQAAPRQNSPEIETGSVMRGLGADLWRWRDALDVQIITGAADSQSRLLAGGLMLERSAGAGREVFLQVDPRHLADRYADDPLKREAVQLSVSRLQRLLAQVLTNLGASPSGDLAGRVCRMGQPQTHRAIVNWEVLGPWRRGADTAAVALLDTVFPGEEDAIAGNDNPNTGYSPGDNSGSLYWRKAVRADNNGFVDLGGELQTADGSAAYAIHKLRSDKDRMVRLRLGVDYWLKLWVNGRLHLEVNKLHASPKPAGFMVDVPLQAGENILTLKVVAGTKGFGFWADMLDLDRTAAASDGSPAAPATANYYRPLFRSFDPYMFHYW
ncbi:hypothetical protein OPIT5_26920 [Opitutaceae bacterium TAV5]|nr:hypothetical protein OPIT5_26920 [Opitutaceae bacterium TAV5]